MVLPGVSPLAVWLVFGPMLLAARLSGYVPPTFRYPFVGAVSLQNQAAARQTFYDAVVDQYASDVAQFVILGAGFDTRAFRMPEEVHVRSFEVDTPEVLTIKQQALQKAGIDPTSVTFVAANFGREDWLNRLVAAGFDTDKPTLFLWEGVTPYLERAAVKDTLGKIASLASGSVIAFDFITTEVLESPSLYLRLVRTLLQAGGEPLKFGIDSTPPVGERLAELLQSCGLSLVTLRIAGNEQGGKRAWGGFAIAIVP
jgi:methyltransferase (TIGR00027 family)